MLAVAQVCRSRLDRWYLALAWADLPDETANRTAGCETTMDVWFEKTADRCSAHLDKGSLAKDKGRKDRLVSGALFMSKRYVSVEAHYIGCAMDVSKAVRFRSGNYALRNSVR